MGKAKAKPKQGQAATTAAQRSRQNRDRVGVGHDDTTDHRLMHSAGTARADRMLDAGTRARFDTAAAQILKRVAAETPKGCRPSLDQAKRAHKEIAVEAERLARSVEGHGAPVTPAGVRHVLEPFDLLRKRGLLDVRDAGMNDVMWYAGLKYRDYWMGAGLNPVSAMDLTKDIVDGGMAPSGMPTSDHAMTCRDRIRAANAQIGLRGVGIFCAVVLHGETIASQRSLVWESRNERTADALLLDRLRDALLRLCSLWSMKPRRSGPIVSSRGSHNEAIRETRRETRA